MTLSRYVLAALLCSTTPFTMADGRPYPDQLLWGDTHLHTILSGDAVLFGGSVTPEVAYRFARGEQVLSRTGQPAQLHRPLDFLVISDHAEGYGLFSKLDSPLLASDEELQNLLAKAKESPEMGIKVMGKLIRDIGNQQGPSILRDPNTVGKISYDSWKNYVSLADEYYQPGEFTTLIGYEWSSNPAGDNLHRVVIYKDGADKAGKMFPFSALNSQNPADLWRWMQRYEEATGGEMLAIPHNSNVSGGKMFPLAIESAALSLPELTLRQRWEPLVEITQIKGDSESHSVLSPSDEFASFGDAGWQLGNLPLSNIETDAMKAGEYVREALKQGLVIEQQRGVNPYQFGVVGSTDAHTGLSAVEEDNFWGKHAANEPSPQRVSQVVRQSAHDPEVKRTGWEYQSGGYAAVWAEENTREAIFAAMQRREVYATTGSRISLRVFAGAELDAAWLASSDWPSKAYQHGVPMGGEMRLTKGQRPSLLIRADKDPMGGNLDRLQVVKGWIDATGEPREKVFDVAWSDREKRSVNDGRLTPVGSTVDVTIPSYSNTIGAAELATLWHDPEFNPKQAAFYYVRVLEIPTPHWVAYDLVRFGNEAPEGAILTHQERAYSSPIWYRP